jgi:hypothetical protein
VLWSPVGAPAGVPGPRRNADECDAGWFAPVATRRRPIFADFSVGFAMARGVFPGGYPRSPPVVLPSPAAPQGLTPGLAAPPYRWPRAWLAAVRGSAVFGVASSVRRPASADRLGGLIAGRGGRGGGRLRWPLRPWRRIFASDAVVTPHLRFGTGSGAASPFLTLPWRPTSAPYHPATAGLRSCPPMAPSPLPVPPGRRIHVPSGRCSLRAHS